MSYDLEVRSDDDYSKAEPRGRVVGLLQRLGATPTGSPTQMLIVSPDEGCRIEIDFGHEGGTDPESVNFVGFGVAYAFLAASGRRMLETAFAVASDLGWRTYDPQAGRYFDPSDIDAALASQGSAGDAVDKISGPGPPVRPGLLGRIVARFVRQTKFMLVVAGLGFAMIGAYAVWTAREEPRRDPRRFVGTVLAATSAVLVLRPVLLELLQPRDPSR